MAEVEVGGGGVHAELDPEPAAGLELAHEILLDEQFVAAALDNGELVVEVELRHVTSAWSGWRDAATLSGTTIGKTTGITVSAGCRF
jgi:hypothetical protein